MIYTQKMPVSLRNTRTGGIFIFVGFLAKKKAKIDEKTNIGFFKNDPRKQHIYKRFAVANGS